MKSKLRPVHIGISLCILAVLLLAANIAFGTVSIPLSEVFSRHHGPRRDTVSSVIVLEKRIPEAFTAFTAGCTLAVCGLMMQNTLPQSPGRPVDTWHQFRSYACRSHSGILRGPVRIIFCHQSLVANIGCACRQRRSTSIPFGRLETHGRQHSSSYNRHNDRLPDFGSGIGTPILRRRKGLTSRS